MLLKGGFGSGIVAVFAQCLQRHHGGNAVFNSRPVGSLDVMNAWNFFGD